MISNHRWECFASYTLAVLNATDHGADLSRESCAQVFIKTV